MQYMLVLNLQLIPDKCTMFVDARLAPNHFPLDQVWQDLEEIFKEIQLNDSDFKASYNVVGKKSMDYG